MGRGWWGVQVRLSDPARAGRCEGPSRAIRVFSKKLFESRRGAFWRGVERVETGRVDTSVRRYDGGGASGGHGTARTAGEVFVVRQAHHERAQARHERGQSEREREQAEQEREATQPDGGRAARERGEAGQERARAEHDGDGGGEGGQTGPGGGHEARERRVTNGRGGHWRLWGCGLGLRAAPR